MKYLTFITVLFSLVACQTVSKGTDDRMSVSTGHLGNAVPEKPAIKQDIPAVVHQLPIVEAPKPTKKLQVFTVVATDLPANELLFALARDARLNLDIDPAISGNVSINAIDQTLPQILKRISRQINLHYYIDGPNLVVERDLPFMRNYQINYLNMERSTTSGVSIATQIASTGSSAEGGGGGGSNSSTDITNKSDNSFWKTMEANLIAIAGSNGAESTVIVNKEGGTISVMTTASNHDAIQAFIDQVMSSVRKQVLIEATVVEVTLSDEFQAGVDWERIANGNGWTIKQEVLGNTLGSPPSLTASYIRNNSDGKITAALKALDSFGDVSVMSSPKIMAINNQTSILKVVDNRVYFTTKVKEEAAINNNTGKTTTFTSTVHTVPVGFVMSVTPFITDSEEIILNIRPTISRILGFIEAPLPDGVNTASSNKVPEIQVREMESVLRVSNGETAIIGGLMENSTDQNSAGIPGLHDVKGVGVLFGTQGKATNKTELVIFLRPRIIDSASLNGDLTDFQRYLKPRLLAE
jgi:MSHA type pilus biogenesis protein MshL